MEYQFLNQMNDSRDVKKLNEHELAILAEEIRDFLIRHVAKTGGHLASNLGVVEITLALHKVFDFPNDKIIFDVGHQSYVHKILTGRRDAFDTLRQKDGLSGFPKRSESVYDCFDTGHSSTSISAAEGMAAARDLRGEHNKIIALIGDGAMTGGMAYEALNAGGMMRKNFIVILNDNDMSIVENVGAMSQYFRRISTNKGYFHFKRSLERVLMDMPRTGQKIMHALHVIKERLKRFIVSPTIFDEMGYAYVGPLDGHNIHLLCRQLQRAKEVDCPVFIHIHTTKGKGYIYAEKKPAKFHGVTQFDIKTGENLQPKVPLNYSRVFGNTMLELGKQYPFVCITPAMTIGSGLYEFSQQYSQRFFDVGIAEQHAVTFGAGLAANGEKSVVAIYATFLQRAYDQVLHDVCLPNLPVVFAIDRAGAVSGDGETHQGVFDIAMLLSMPNMTMVAPASFADLKMALTYAIAQHNGPIAIRYPKGKQSADFAAQPYTDHKAQVLCTGKDVCLLAVGHMVEPALKAVQLLKEKGIFCTLIHLRFIKPLDEETIAAHIKQTQCYCTIEDGMAVGGAGESIVHKMNELCIYKPSVVMGYPDTFLAQATAAQIQEEYGLTAEGICQQIQAMIQK